MKKFITLFVVSLVLSSNALAQGMNKIVFYTENTPPYNFISNGQPAGIAVDLLAKTLKVAKSKITAKDFIFGTWTKIYDKVLQTPYTSVFSNTRTITRENKFKWLGPIIPSRTILFAKKGTPEVKNLIDIKGEKLGVLSNDVGENVAFDAGFTKSDLIYYPDVDALIDALIAGKIKYLIYEENIANWLLKKRGQQGNYVVVNIVRFDNLSYAFNKETPDDIIDALQDAMDEVKLSGDYQEIIEKYLK